MKIHTWAELQAEGKKAEILYWVGCAVSFDSRAQKIARAFVKLLDAAGVSFAILGTEEGCTGDPARRAGNEFLFQMLALQNIQTLKQYGIKKIVTTCPHCLNTLKNEYPHLGGYFQVWHHTEYLLRLVEKGKLKLPEDKLRARVTFHDPCYLGRVNGQYQAPRALLQKAVETYLEMPRHGAHSFCCGAGGAQMFKEPEKGTQDVNIARTEEALSLHPSLIAVGCPFCMTMLTDGVKYAGKQDEVQVKDIAEILVEVMEL
ncbi:MAG: (Fe-S)-binding protein [Bacteroidia bacterium]